MECVCKRGDYMATNECGIEVPEEIIARALKLGSINCPKYVYKDGEYGNKLPAASIGGEKATRIRHLKVLHLRKIELGNGWVVFKSAGGHDIGGYVRKTEGKGKCEPCIICNEDRFTDGAHFPKPDRKGGTETISLCPTHHKLLDNGRLSIAELETIWKNKYPSFKTFIE